MPIDHELEQNDATIKTLGRELAGELSKIAEEAKASSVDKKEHIAAHKGFEVRVDKEILEASTDLSPEMREWLTKLPDALAFADAVTLIVGKNGSGKTQFARALVGALTSQRVDTDPRSKPFYFNEGEPAGVIAEALSLTDPREGNIINGFLEGAELMHGSREWAKQQAYQANLGNRVSSTEHRLSSRQLFNQSVDSVLEMRINSHRGRVFGGSDRLEEKTGDVVVVFDEPEQGLDTDGQMGLAQDMQKFLPESDTLIVPTNNVMLAKCSDLPRIDISHPERGVHRPSDYNELYRLVKG